MPEIKTHELNGRDIYECSNQLSGYIGPSTPEKLARFLSRESNAAGDLADEIARLRRELAEARAAALEEAAQIADAYECHLEDGYDINSINFYDSGMIDASVGIAAAIRSAVEGKAK